MNHHGGALPWLGIRARPLSSAISYSVPAYSVSTLQVDALYCQADPQGSWRNFSFSTSSDRV